MALLTKAPRGTQDILPGQTEKWQYVEQALRETAQLYGIQEIRVPTFEHTELFNRSVGDTTDVVQKEMYTFQDKGDRSITLRPEGTAGAARALIEHGLLAGTLPVKVWYNASCFRYEKPQAGRLREFHQFGIELIGSPAPIMDVQAIAFASDVFRRLGLEDIRLELNSIGCPECRANYHRALRQYLEERKDSLCETCCQRLEKNPMRVLDCKNPQCQAQTKDAPTILDYLCPQCQEHFQSVQQQLADLGIGYTINPRIVRGLDYYTRTVFEFVTDRLGAQSTVCGGGRYDGVMEGLGGPATPALGFGIGLERLILLMETCGCPFPEPRPCVIYIGSMGEKAAVKASQLAAKMRQEGFYAECDTMGRSVKGQMKYADKVGAKYSCIIGDNELEAGMVQVKNMATGEKTDVSLNEGSDNCPGLVTFIYEDTTPVMLEDVENSIQL